VAKKKGTRKAASRGARKKTAVRRRAPKAATRPRAASEWVGTGLENPKRVSFIPLKKIITEQIKRLEPFKDRDDVKMAYEVLTTTKRQLSAACVDPDPKKSMVIDF
jgi:hypothetical protein